MNHAPAPDMGGRRITGPRLRPVVMTIVVVIGVMVLSVLGAVAFLFPHAASPAPSTPAPADATCASATTPPAPTC